MATFIQMDPEDHSPAAPDKPGPGTVENSYLVRTQ